jgi:hypothetical protein
MMGDPHSMRQGAARLNVDQVGRVTAQPTQQQVTDNASPQGPVELGEFINVQITPPPAVKHAGIRTDDARLKTPLRQVLGQTQGVRTTSSNGKPPGNQQH